MIALGLLALLALPGAEEDLVRSLRDLAARTPPAPSSGQAEREELAARLREANLRESQAWRRLQGRADWEKYRDVRLAALRSSLGTYPQPPRDLRLRIRKTLPGDGFRIDNLTFQSRPGLLVTANLYRPEKPGKAMPALLIVHSHHAPKTQGELQDMGVMWARAGCVVLVMDVLGHGERRQHPFRTRDDYTQPYRVSRQDYYFRYDLAVQLQTIGDSLMGWIVYDLQRGIDLLVSWPGVDAKKIILLGAVAGGGDPAAVTAALDSRVAAVAPFNFGGPQPETRQPLPETAEDRFNYAGSGSWESTRNLAFSARDGFLPWLIVGSVAPRRHLYGHEFAWDEQRDPVWKRVKKIHAWYDGATTLASTHGSGSVSGKPPAATHCTNIGPVHRKGIHASLKAWFDLPLPVEKTDRRPAADLLCLEATETLPPMRDLAAAIGQERIGAARRRLAGLSPAEQRKLLRSMWSKLLGRVEPFPAACVQRSPPTPLTAQATAEWITFPTRTGPDRVRVLLLLPTQKRANKRPTTVLFGQAAPAALLAARSVDVAALLRSGHAVAVVELGGHASLPAGANRGRMSPSTAAASTALMLGDPRLAARLRELRAALRGLRSLSELDPPNLSLWGDSLASSIEKSKSRTENRPLELPQPPQAEPLGAVLALLTGLFEEDVAAIRAHGGLAGYASLLGSPFCRTPYDVIVPGALTAGDLGDIVAALAPRPVRLTGLVDGRNVRVGAKTAEQLLAPAAEVYRQRKAAEQLRIED